MLQNLGRRKAWARIYSQQRRSHTTESKGSDLRNALEPLKGTFSIITGASRGIGRAIATTFANKGSQCLLIGRDEAALKETQSQCTSSSSQDHSIQTGDIGTRDFWTSISLPKFASSTPAPQLILVNAAGITHASLLLRTSPSQIESVIQTNLMGTLWGSQIIGKQMLRQKSGVIVNIASLLAIHGGAGSAAYAASKAGVVGLTRALAAELGSAGVRVNAVLPGYVKSDMTEGTLQDITLLLVHSQFLDLV